MNNKIIFFLIILSVFSTSYGQEKPAENTAPIKWERYKITEKNVSILFPKLPVKTDYSNVCDNIEFEEYTVYADSIVYSLKIYSKNGQPIPDYCSTKKEFSEGNFFDRLSQVKKGLTKETVESTVPLNKTEAFKFSDQLNNLWIINDYENKSWYELTVFGSNETKKEVKNFIESIRTGGNQTGIEIGEGSETTLGDEILIQSNDVATKPVGVNVTDKPIIIRLKPRAKYTDDARRNKVQGAVRLRITFNANGSIGSITLVNEGLKDGLTDEAMKVAKKLVFIPAQRNGVKYTVTKIVEYHFSLY